MFGKPLAVEADDPELRSRLAWLLEDLPRATGPVRRRLRLVATGADLTLLDGGAVLRSGMARREAESMLLWQLNQLGASVETHAVLHAGCVAAAGRGAVLAGPSGSGKSTLVAALVQRGFAYLSDELAGYSWGDGLVWPHAVPIGLRPGGGALLRSLPASRFEDPHRRPLRPCELSGAIGGPVPPAALVVVGHRRGATATLAPLSRTEALHELCGHALNLRARPQTFFPALGRLAATAPAFRLMAGDLDSTCALLRGVLLGDAGT